MKMAVSTVACMDASWQDVLSCAVQARMDAVEIRLNDDGSVFGLADVGITEMARAYHDSGVAISDLGTSVRFSEYDEKALERAERAIILAEKTGATAIRVFPGSFVKRFSAEATHDIDGMARFLREASAVAEKHSVEIWIETHNEFSTGKSLRCLLDKTDCANVKVIWDLIHPYEYGERPEDTIRLLNGAIAHVHVKDGKKATDADCIDYIYTKLGEGEIPLSSMFDLLKSAGYDGYYSLEWEKEWRPEIRSIYGSTQALLTDWNAYLSRVEER